MPWRPPAKCEHNLYGSIGSLNLILASFQNYKFALHPFSVQIRIEESMKPFNEKVITTYGKRHKKQKSWNVFQHFAPATWMRTFDLLQGKNLFLSLDVCNC